MADTVYDAFYSFQAEFSTKVAASIAAMERAAGRGDAETVWRARSSDEIYIVVAGGPDPQNVYIGAGMPQTRLR